MENVIIHTNDWVWGTSVDIIRDNGTAYICVKFDKEYPDVAYLCALSVYEPVRRLGLGKIMMAYALLIAQRNDKSWARLYVEKDKEWLVQWYKSLGFKIFMEDDKYYEMIKSL